MKLVEFYAGSRSIGKVAGQMGHKVFSTDLIDFGGIDYITDILNFDCSMIPFEPDVLWFSPPCTGFSVAAIGHHWTGGRRAYIPKTDTARLGIKLLEKTLEIIKQFPNAIYWIENPRGLMRKMPQLEGLPRYTVTYCQYGDTRMKPTDIWTNCTTWQPRPMCKNGDSCHVSAPRGAKTGTQGLKGAFERSMIPQSLCKDVVLASKQHCEIETTGNSPEGE